MEKKKVDQLFPKHCFWDMDMGQIDLVKDKDIIIPRALFFEFEFEKHLDILESIYSEEEIISALMRTREPISNSVCSKISRRYNSKPFKRFSA